MVSFVIWVHAVESANGLSSLNRWILGNQPTKIRGWLDKTPKYDAMVAYEEDRG